MKKTMRSLAFFLMMGLSWAAQAGKYEFSYTFGSGETISGVLDGSATGDLITIDAIDSLLFAGTDWASKVTATSFSGETQGTTSLSGAMQDFRLLYDGFPGEFFAFDVSTDLVYWEQPGNSIARLIYNTNGDQVYDYPYASASWSISAVPEPATYGMLLTGLALVGFAARKKVRA